MPHPTSRFTILETPMVAPGQCGICGGANKEFYVDLKLDFEYYGSLIFCNECVADLARTLGYALPEEVAAVSSRLSEAVAEGINLKARLKSAEAYIRESFTIDPGYSTSLNTNLSVVTPDSVDEEAVSEPGPDDSESDESASEQGPDDVRDSSEPDSTPHNLTF